MANEMARVTVTLSLPGGGGRMRHTDLAVVAFGDDGEAMVAAVAARVAVYAAPGGSPVKREAVAAEQPALPGTVET